MSMYDLSNVDEDRQLTLLECLPTWYEASVWGNLRMGGGPMSEDEFNQFSLQVSRESANTCNRLRCLTLTGWYISLWFDWVKYMTWTLFHNRECKFTTKIIGFN